MRHHHTRRVRHVHLRQCVRHHHTAVRDLHRHLRRLFLALRAQAVQAIRLRAVRQLAQAAHRAATVAAAVHRAATAVAAVHRAAIVVAAVRAEAVLEVAVEDVDNNYELRITSVLNVIEIHNS